jgi:hypothetical protein
MVLRRATEQKEYARRHSHYQQQPSIPTGTQTTYSSLRPAEPFWREAEKANPALLVSLQLTGGEPMFLTLFIILLLAWIFGFTLFHVTSFLIHILLIAAVIALIMHFVRPRGTVA